MRHYTSLRRRADFARVTRRGKRSSSAHLTCVSVDGVQMTRVGLTVSAAIGNAVTRNRLRRRIRAILDGCIAPGAPARDVVVIARPGAGELSFAQLVAEIERTFEARA